MGNSILGAAKEGRRELLEAVRDRIAEEIDKGVPAHALRNLIAELSRIDLELRGEADVSGDPEIPDDQPFDPSTI